MTHASMKFLKMWMRYNLGLTCTYYYSRIVQSVTLRSRRMAAAITWCARTRIAELTFAGSVSARGSLTDRLGTTVIGTTKMKPKRPVTLKKDLGQLCNATYSIAIGT